MRPVAQELDRGITLAGGRGSILVDSTGREYIDCASGFGVAILGHHHPEVDAAIHRQVDTLISAHQSFNTTSREALLTVLERVIPAPLNNVTFCSSGAECVEAALKFARAVTGRQTVVAMARGYHGRTYGALSVTARAHYREPFGDMLPGVVHIPFDDVDAAMSAIDTTVAAVVVEPIQGEAGIRLPHDGYLRALRRRCDETGALLVMDEIQTAFRTGTALAADVLPDILCIAKAIANGAALGLTITTDEVAARIPKGAHSSTFAANPLSCAAGAATLGVLGRPDVLARAAGAGQRFMDNLRALGQPLIREVRGRGLMVGVELRTQAGRYLRALQAEGVLALPAGSTVLRFLPSVLIEEALLDRVVETVGRVLHSGRAGDVRAGEVPSVPALGEVVQV